ncbi:DNA methyltransferase [Brevundimonas sp. DC300-4]|uniref:DNA methyltransferase n=1 Tax=Brevundimonas sp. DC300-4 TaxID=2804594 RepID=UPI003CEC2BD2
MSDSLTDLILSLTPEDGSSMGNGAMVALLREKVPGLSDEDYASARDALVDQGVLGRGRGRGGSIYRADVADLTLEMDDDNEASQPSGRPARKVKNTTARRSGEPILVLSYRHGETRVNNPEVGMVHAGTDPDGARTRWAYDPHLDPVLNFDSARAGVEKLIDDALASSDPQAMKDALIELKRLQAPYLTWTGKAERTSFEVDTVSLHVHERVDPATILAHAAKRLKGKDAGSQWRQADLFAAPFENLPLRQALDFYSHEKGWSNRLVAGDSQLVMNSLLTKESMGGKVQMIYIDPPYGIKYGSNFQPFTNKRDVKDRSDEDLTQEPEMIKAFRDTWELGIHSYLTYLRDRLFLARELLHESGSVFVQISDENLHHVREVMDEVFGAENFVSIITYTTTSAQTSRLIANPTDYIIWFSKAVEKMKWKQLFTPKKGFSDEGTAYNRVQFENGLRRTLNAVERSREDSLPDKAKVFSPGDMTSQRQGRESGPGSAMWFPVDFRGENFTPSGGRGWSSTESGLARVIRGGRAENLGKNLDRHRLRPGMPLHRRQDLLPPLCRRRRPSTPVQDR